MQPRQERRATPSSLLSQWWSLGAIICDKRTSGRHVKAAWVIIDRFVKSYGNSRASLRYIERATGMGRPAVVKACRELDAWGYVDRRVGSGTRPSEYAPRWATTARGTKTDTTTQDDPSGVEMDTSCGVDLHTSRGASGVDSHTESYLLSGLQADLVVGTNEVSATGPGADAPAEAGGFERVWRAYKKHGNKQASRKAFEAIPNPEVDLITSRAASWAASAKPGQRRMPLEKWLAAEKYDEADRRGTPVPVANTVEEKEHEMPRRKSDEVDASAAAEATRSIERAAIRLNVPSGVPLTVVGAEVTEDGGDSWLQIKTERGDVAILIQGGTGRQLKQEAGQAHLARLAEACEQQVEAAEDLIGATFVVTGDGFAAPIRAAV